LFGDFAKGVRPLFFLALIFISALAPAQQPFIKNGVDRRASSFLRKAMEARDAGNLHQAEVFWLQAKSIRPSIGRPEWLNNIPAKKANSVSAKDQKSEMEAMVYADAKSILEQKLESNPNDIEARRLYLDLAQKNKDFTQVNRHSLYIDKVEAGTQFWKGILVVILILIGGWQILAFIKDWKNRP
jgi:uncharacterized protein HemY